MQMVVQNCNHKPRDFFKIANHIKKITKTKMISMSKYVKNTTYSKNDIHCTIKLIFPISSLDVFHQHLQITRFVNNENEIGTPIVLLYFH